MVSALKNVHSGRSKERSDIETRVIDVTTILEDETQVEET